MLNRQSFRRLFHRSSRGFSLIEVVIALGLLGIIGLALLFGLATASRALVTADERATAESLARSQMEYIKSQPYADNYTASIPPDYIGAGYDAIITAQPLHDPDDGIQRIVITVAHHGKDILTSGDYTLEGYKVDR